MSREVIKTRMRRDWKMWFECYQLAGGLLLTGEDDPYTKGERARLTELLLDVLSSPERYTARLIRIQRDLAVMK